VGPDGVRGLTVEGALEVLEASGVPASIIYQGSVSDLAGYLEAGHGIMVFIDSGEVWEGEADEDNAPDHMAIVAGIDTERGVVLLSDPGTPTGNLEEVPIEVFQDAWADSDDAMIVADEPAPTHVPADEADVHAASQTAMTTARTVTGPWVLLPVALPAPA
jgi:hypothetical protein